MNTNNFAAEFDLDGSIQELASARAANELALSTGIIRLATCVQAHYSFEVCSRAGIPLFKTAESGSAQATSSVYRFATSEDKICCNPILLAPLKMG